jgi:dTMP kinase
MFITFEGGEGCGKSTHARFLSEYLKRAGYPVLLTREPGATDFGKKIRRILLGSRKTIPPQAEMLLIAADRTAHVEQVIKPALKKGNIVISDRYVDSSIAYQAGGRSLPKSLVEGLNEISSAGIMPELTLLLDLPVKEGFMRIAKTKREIDRFEKETAGFHQRVYAAYKKIAAAGKGRVLVVNSNKPVAEVQKAIIKAVMRKLNEKPGT